MCSLEIKSGGLEILNLTKATELYTGQEAKLKCIASYFVKIVNTNMLLGGKLRNHTNVVCQYDGPNPRWVDEITGLEVVCDKECLKDEDCVQPNLHFCINHRYQYIYSNRI